MSNLDKLFDALLKYSGTLELLQEEALSNKEAAQRVTMEQYYEGKFQGYRNAHKLLKEHMAALLDSKET